MGRPAADIPETDLRKLCEQGWNLLPLAKRYGCSKQAVLNCMNRLGIPAQPKHSCPGPKNPAWKGGRYFDADGYILIYAPDHPHATADNRVREHRLVAERMIGRYLTQEEVVDHIDGNPSNNHPNNLRVFARNSEHLAVTLKGRVPQWTEDGKRRIKDGPNQGRNSAQSIHPEDVRN